MQYIETTLDLATKEYPEAKHLTLSQDPDDSVMFGIMTEGQLGGFQKHKYIKVLLAFNDNELVGWAWTFNYNRKSYNIDGGKRGRAYMMFVKPKHRRKGIGLHFYQWANNIASKLHRALHVFPWDNGSRKFFSKVNARNKYRFID